MSSQEEYNEAKERCRRVALNMKILYMIISIFNEPPDVISERETLIKNLVKNKATTSSRNAFKVIGTAMSNGPY